MAFLEDAGEFKFLGGKHHRLSVNRHKIGALPYAEWVQRQVRRKFAVLGSCDIFCAVDDSVE